MTRKDFKLIKISRNDHIGFIKDFDVNSDLESCVITSTKVFNSECWFNITSENSVNQRTVQCITYHDVKLNEILAKDDVFYNICQYLGLSTTESSHNVVCELDGSPVVKIAESVEIAPISSAVELDREDEEMLLFSHFSTPRLVHIDDILMVPLSDTPYLAKSAAYHSISYFYYKVTNITYTNEKCLSPSDGIYVVQNHSQLYCQPGLGSQLPPIASHSFSLVDGFDKLSITSPNLAPYVNQVKEIIAPFSLAQRPNCLPLFLLMGSEGLGQKSVVQQSAALLGFHFVLVHCQDFIGISVSAVETKLEFILEKCLKMGPCVVAFSDIQLMGKDVSGVEDARLVSCFLDKVVRVLSLPSKHPLVFIGIADTKEEDLLPSIGRVFLHSIKFQPPKSDVAVSTVEWLAATKGFIIDDVGKNYLEKKLLGFVHDDLNLLVDHSIRMHYENNSNGQLLNQHNFATAIELMESAYSDTIGAAKVAQVRWEDVGGLGSLKDEIMLTLRLPTKGSSGRLRRSGILLYGPPGTGKTLIAKAVATECSMNFLSVKGPELMNMYVGQSERNVREVFERGREAAPCVLFFDELDSLAPARGKSGDGGGVTDRVVSQLLAELDGLHSNRGLFVIAATNRPDLVDPALLRPGRFDKSFYLGPCSDYDSKFSVLQALTNKFVFSENNLLKEVVQLLPPLLTGADIYSVCSNAWLSAARKGIALSQKGDVVSLPLAVTLEDFKRGMEDLVPSITAEDLRKYQRLSGESTLSP